MESEGEAAAALRRWLETGAPLISITESTRDTHFDGSPDGAERANSGVPARIEAAGQSFDDVEAGRGRR